MPVHGDKIDDLVKSLEDKLECKTTSTRGLGYLFHRATMGYESFLGKGILLLKEKGSHHYEVYDIYADFLSWTILRRQKET